MPYKFMIAGTNSGAGKTSITIALLAALKDFGFNVLPFKVGPDFIDPGYHTLVSGNSSINLDGWMLSRDYNFKNFYSKFKSGKDIGVVEGVMGLYDGFSGTSDDGSSAQIAKWLDVPVILVVNVKSMARSVAAVINGYKDFDKNLKLKGVILNNVGSENHFNYLKDAIDKYCNVEIVGYFLKGDFPELKSRHLGLVTVEDNIEFKKKVKIFSEVAKKRINFEKLLNIAKFDNLPGIKIKKTKFKKKFKVAIAKDNAFCFYYHDNLKILENIGAEIVYFSPLKDKKLPEGVEFIYLGGGYPELYAKELSENKLLINEIKSYIEDGNFVYAECGGFMYLTEGIYINDKFYPLVGIFKDRAKLDGRLRALGYREVKFLKDTFFAKKGEIARGHEFHYSHLVNSGKDLEKIYEITPRSKNSIQKEGYIYKNSLGSYIHLHFGSFKKFF